MFYKELSKDQVDNYFSIENEVTLLMEKWQVYRNLFQNQQNAKVLWECSDVVYSVFIESLKDDLIMTISRLTDKAVTGKSKNSTLFRLYIDLKNLLENRYYTQSVLDEEKEKSDKKNFPIFEQYLQELEVDIEQLKNMRNKRKAHRDLETILKEHRNELTQEVIKNDFDAEIKEIIEKIQSILAIFSNIAFRMAWLPGLVIPEKGVGYFTKNLEEGNKWRKNDIEKKLHKLRSS